MPQHRWSLATLFELISLACFIGNGHADRQGVHSPEGTSLLQRTGGTAILDSATTAQDATVSLILDSQGVTETFRGEQPDGPDGAVGGDSLEALEPLEWQAGGVATHEDEATSGFVAVLPILDSKGVTETLHSKRSDGADGSVGANSLVALEPVEWRASGVASHDNETTSQDVAVSPILDLQGATETLRSKRPDGPDGAIGGDSLVALGPVERQASGVAVHDDKITAQDDALSLIVDSQDVTETMHDHRSDGTDETVGVESLAALEQRQHGAVPTAGDGTASTPIGGSDPTTVALLLERETSTNVTTSTDVAVTLVRGVDKLSRVLPKLLQLEALAQSTWLPAGGQESVEVAMLVMAVGSLCLVVTCVAICKIGEYLGHSAPRSTNDQLGHSFVPKSTAGHPPASAATLSVDKPGRPK